MCSQFLPISKNNHWCVFFLFSMEKTNHMFLTKCILHMCEVSVFPAGHSWKGGFCSLGISSPGYTISCLWPGPVQCHTALTSCCGLCMVAFELSALLPTFWESCRSLWGRRWWFCHVLLVWCRRGMPSSSISRAGSAPKKAGPWPFHELPTACVILSVSTWERSHSAWVKHWWWGTPHLPSLVPHPHGGFDPVTTLSPLVQVHACPSLCCPCLLPAGNLTSVAAQGLGQVGQGQASGGSVRLCLPLRVQSHGFCHAPLSLSKPCLVRNHEKWEGRCRGPVETSTHSGQWRRSQKSHPTTAYLTGGFQGFLRAAA